MISRVKDLWASTDCATTLNDDNDDDDIDDDDDGDIKTSCLYLTRKQLDMTQSSVGSSFKNGFI